MKLDCSKILAPWRRFHIHHPGLIRAPSGRASAARAGLELLQTLRKRALYPLRVVCISDTHSDHDRVPPLPPGNILIHAGDLTRFGTEPEIHDALRWLSAAPHPHKVFVAGNHDTALATPAQRESILAAYPGLIYLEDSSARLTVRSRQLTVYGSPRTPQLGQGVFHYPHHEPGAWAIPRGTDILVTHGPPRSHLDARGLGCAQLRDALWDVRPLLHVFGHIHYGRGVERADWSPLQRMYECLCDANTVAGWADGGAAAGTAGWGLGVKGRARTSAAATESTVFVNASSQHPSPNERYRGAIVVDLATLDGNPVSLISLVGQAGNSVKIIA